MFKKIPQDQIVRRTFQVNKDVKLTQDDVDVYQVYGVRCDLTVMNADTVVGILIW